MSGEMSYVWKSTSTATVSGAYTVISWNNVGFDTDNMWNPLSPGRLTINTGGRYHLFAGVDWEDVCWGFGTRTRRLRFLLNSISVIGQTDQEPVEDGAGVWGNRIVLNTIYELSYLDYVQLQAYQQCGGNVDLLAGAQRFGMVRLNKD